MAAQMIRSYGVLVGRAQGPKVLRLVYAYDARDAAQQVEFAGECDTNTEQTEWPIEVGPAKAMRLKHSEFTTEDNS